MHVNTLLVKSDSENLEHFFIGDLNCDLQSKDNVNVKALLNITHIYGLEQLINEPTRITPTTSTLIDLIFTNRPENVYCSGLSHVAISDHSLVYAYRKISIPTFLKRVNLITYRQFKHFNGISVYADILGQTWDDIKQLYDRDNMWKRWKELFLDVCGKHTPMKTKQTRDTKSPWIPTILKKRMNFKDRLKRKRIKTKDPFIWNQFRMVKNQENWEINSTKKT